MSYSPSKSCHFKLSGGFPEEQDSVCIVSPDTYIQAGPGGSPRSSSYVKEDPLTSNTDQGLIKALSTRDVFMAGVGLVVASSTLVSDFEGWIGIGTAFAMALLMGFVINLLLGLSAAELAVTYPRAGAIYDYGAAAFGGKGAKASITGIFLGFSFYAMFGLVGALETNAGAFGLRAIFNTNDAEILDTSTADVLLPWIIGMTILAVIPNLLGIQILARVEFLVVIVMLSIRWIFGLFGYFGAGSTGGWSASNWDAGLSMWDWFGSDGVIAAGLIIAIWSFIGIEFVGPLAEETKDPARMIPKGSCGAWSPSWPPRCSWASACWAPPRPPPGRPVWRPPAAAQTAPSCSWDASSGVRVAVI